MTIKAIIWDLDGTLIHFKIDYMRARKGAIRILKKHGIPKEFLTTQDSIIDNVAKAKIFFKDQGKSQEEINDIIDEVDQKVIEVEYDAAVNATATHGIEEVLQFCKEKNLKQAVYTLNTTQNTKISLEKANILKYFDAIVGRDEVKNAKPHPDHLFAICNHLHVTPTEVIVIGDTHRDIRGAKELNTLSIAIKTKMSLVTDSSNIEFFYKADKFIEEREIPSKLIDALKELFKKV